MRVLFAIVLFVGLAGWVWVDAAASGAINPPIKLEVNISYH
jgi:hypothetical protein